MPRPLHPDTRTQRAADPDAVSPHARALGHEPRDAPPGGVAAAVAGFVGLMLIGLAVAGMLVWRFSETHPVAPTVFAGVRPPPPAPRLLAHPREERVRIEAIETARLAHGGTPIDEAMRQVVARGWADAELPPLTPEDAARGHAGARQ